MNRVLLFVLTVSFFSCQQAQLKRPILILSGDSINIGRGKKDANVSANFFIYNRGNAPLNIKGLGVDCGCTKAVIADSTIQSGDSTKVVVDYNTKVATDSGIFYKSIVIRSNDPDEYKVIKLVGEVQ